MLADDSGLAVDALGRAPGVFSARYAGEHGDDEANNRKVLDALADVPDDRRGAAFVCALALADPSGTIRLEADGACRGRITRSPAGPDGFGYDPLFLIPEYHKTFGELSPLVKNQLSHRARAFAHLRPELDRLISLKILGGKVAVVNIGSAVPCLPESAITKTRGATGLSRGRLAAGNASGVQLTSIGPRPAETAAEERVAACRTSARRARWSSA